MMEIFGIAGWSGSGKTTLIRALIPVLSAQGKVVGTIKHTHHQPQFGDDADRAAGEDGATEAMIAGPERFVLVHEYRHAPELPLPELLAKIVGVDIVLVEGFKFFPHPRLEVWNSTLGKPMLAMSDRTIIGVATDRGVDGLGKTGVVHLHRDDILTVADFIQRNSIPMGELCG